jgi:thioredoxin-dependent peroxiredoxin
MKLIIAGVASVIVVVCLLVSFRSSRAAGSPLLKEGALAPDFSTEMVVGDRTEPISLKSFAGKKIVLYFYPKDNTPGCTKEACAFRDGFARFQRAGLVVLGCSVDTAASHKAFISKYHLPFPLLLDPGKKIATAYGAANGIPVLGLNRRITYVIGEDRRILKVYPHVDPAVHAGEILRDLGVKKAASASKSD